MYNLPWSEVIIKVKRSKTQLFQIEMCKVSFKSIFHIVFKGTIFHLCLDKLVEFSDQKIRLSRLGIYLGAMVPNPLWICVDLGGSTNCHFFHQGTRFRLGDPLWGTGWPIGAPFTVYLKVTHFGAPVTNVIECSRLL